jgi:hypothetical protein
MRKLTRHVSLILLPRPVEEDELEPLHRPAKDGNLLQTGLEHDLQVAQLAGAKAETPQILGTRKEAA